MKADAISFRKFVTVNGVRHGVEISADLQSYALRGTDWRAVPSAQSYAYTHAGEIAHAAISLIHTLQVQHPDGMAY